MKKETNKIYPVYLEFLDHVSESTWIDKHELTDFGPEIIHAFGWLVEETDDCYKVAGQVCSDGNVGDTMVILKSTVSLFKKVKFKIPKKK